MTAVTITRGNRFLLHALARNVAENKPHAYRQGRELIPVLCPVPDALSVFDSLVSAVRDGEEQVAAELLDRLVGEQG